MITQILVCVRRTPDIRHDHRQVVTPKATIRAWTIHDTGRVDEYQTRQPIPATDYGSYTTELRAMLRAAGAEISDYTPLAIDCVWDVTRKQLHNQGNPLEPGTIAGTLLERIVR